ncbi:MAG: hypothetical protein KDK60_02910 [Chlamydiia bacterium]|nr:hypothetical protein [Chlamydiia bacterium]
MGENIKWKVLALESEVISKDILKREFLTPELYETYMTQARRLQSRLDELKEASKAEPKPEPEERLTFIQNRLKYLNPEKKVATNLKFYTQKISHFESRLTFLRESLSAFNGGVGRMISSCKKERIEKEIALIEEKLAGAKRQLNSLKTG